MQLYSGRAARPHRDWKKSVEEQISEPGEPGEKHPECHRDILDQHAFWTPVG